MTTAVTPSPDGPHRSACRGLRWGDLSAVGLVLGGAVSVQFGSAVAVLLFPLAGVPGTVTLRLVLGAVALSALTRPRLRGHSGSDWALIGGFATALAGMNTLFYQAADRIPLGPAVTVEVLGPLVLSVLASRRAVSWLWASLALAGVFLLGSDGFDRLDPAGVAFAGGSGGMWALYILFGSRVSRRFPGAEGLTLAMGLAALAALPPGTVTTGSALLDPVALGLGAVVATLSSALPYSLELLAMRRIPATVFAVLTCLGPAVAALAGYLVLDQSLVATEGAAIVLVVVACAGTVLTRSRGGLAAPPGTGNPPRSGHGPV